MNSYVLTLHYIDLFVRLHLDVNFSVPEDTKIYFALFLQSWFGFFSSLPYQEYVTYSRSLAAQLKPNDFFLRHPQGAKNVLFV